jgi:hypothetical protein
MTTFTTEDRENSENPKDTHDVPTNIVDRGASINKKEFEKSFEALFGKNKKAILREVEGGVYEIEIHNKEDDFDMDGRC